ncbi:MAG: hypothetical protein D3919_14655, partial [Candidatus Electrothrix sp. AW5]|nr:hypothetical protein [Candidatus Electrothrix gigas]
SLFLFSGLLCTEDELINEILRMLNKKYRRLSRRQRYNGSSDRHLSFPAELTVVRCLCYDA